MNHTIQRVAALCGLRLAYYVTAALLAGSFLLLVPTDFRTASPLYILLCLAVLPSLVEAILFSKVRNKKRENDSSLPLFCKKYHYNNTKYQSMNLAYLLLFILLAAWHISYTTVTELPAFVTSLPMLTAIFSLLTRFLGMLGYRLYFHFFPFKAMR